MASDRFHQNAECSCKECDVTATVRHSNKVIVSKNMPPLPKDHDEKKYRTCPYPPEFYERDEPFERSRTFHDNLSSKYMGMSEFLKRMNQDESCGEDVYVQRLEALRKHQEALKGTTATPEERNMKMKEIMHPQNFVYKRKLESIHVPVPHSFTELRQSPQNSQPSQLRSLSTEGSLAGERRSTLAPYKYGNLSSLKHRLSTVNERHELNERYERLKVFNRRFPEDFDERPILVRRKPSSSSETRKNLSTLSYHDGDYSPLPPLVTSESKPATVSLVYTNAIKSITTVKSTKRADDVDITTESLPKESYRVATNEEKRPARSSVLNAPTDNESQETSLDYSDIEVENMNYSDNEEYQNSPKTSDNEHYGNESEDSCLSEVFQIGVEGTESKTVAESLLALGDSDAVTSDNGIRKAVNSRKRGGGKLGRRRKRGYIYDPKPLIPKTKSTSLPNEQKDADYWSRRQRNNEAAKRSRESRRVKELETMNLVKELRETNEDLRAKVKDLQGKNTYLEKLLKGTGANYSSDSGNPASSSSPGPSSPKTETKINENAE